jgi:hypothetical protein
MRLISGIGIVFTVAVTLLAFVGLLSVGLGWAERTGAAEATNEAT